VFQIKPRQLPLSSDYLVIESFETQLPHTNKTDEQVSRHFLDNHFIAVHLQFVRQLE